MTGHNIEIVTTDQPDGSQRHRAVCSCGKYRGGGNSSPHWARINANIHVRQAVKRESRSGKS